MSTDKKSDIANYSTCIHKFWYSEKLHIRMKYGKEGEIEGSWDVGVQERLPRQKGKPTDGG